MYRRPNFANFFDRKFDARRLSLAVAGCLMLAACGDDPEPAPVEEATASGAGAKGDVLPGSISDAMLPLDTVTSTAPRASIAEGSDGDEEDAEEPGEMDDTEEPDE